jgi:hypothetical protein
LLRWHSSALGKLKGQRTKEAWTSALLKPMFECEDPGADKHHPVAVPEVAVGPSVLFRCLTVGITHNLRPIYFNPTFRTLPNWIIERDFASAKNEPTLVKGLLRRRSAVWIPVKYGRDLHAAAFRADPAFSLK